jgi:hypothetical protein
VLNAGLELVGRVHLQALAEDEQADQLAGLHDGALAVLAWHHPCDLERCPRSVLALTEGGE